MKKYRAVMKGEASGSYKLQKRFLFFWWKDVIIKDEWQEPMTDEWNDSDNPVGWDDRDRLLRQHVELWIRLESEEPEYDFVDYLHEKAFGEEPPKH